MIEMFTLASGTVGPDAGRTMQFPAGEQHVIPADGATGPLAVLVRGAGAEDLVAAGMAIDAARRAGRRAALVLPYLPGARQDRGVPFGAEVYARLLNALGADRVLAIDPHSPVMPALIENLEVYPLSRFVRQALTRRVADAHVSDYVGVIAPDAGAAERSGAVAHALGLPLVQARKHRDFATGALSGFTCDPLPSAGKLLVVDDICDGGGTFRGLAEATGLGPDRLDLWVTHGVFSGRAPQLREHFGHIHTTDSHPGHTHPDVAATIHPLTDTLIREALR
ncbi:ribose-phosphate pyrophosphokinase [Brachybacterium sp. YJGR34]|uniref:ribose-phosphate pyrophosphokinase n=1 Tax=Brachybacterium sp. YJGR34 TaxID=2059911 RepID=UPI000E0C66FE|nr:ribose-phosphate pyrophosphokinase [Brachybacterium sp. YJGR34]